MELTELKDRIIESFNGSNEDLEKVLAIFVKKKVMNYEKKSKGIWRVEDIPSEKMLAKGSHSLTLSETLSLLVGDLPTAQKILSDSGNTLSGLYKMSLRELSLYMGVGPAKAKAIRAALELGRRYSTEYNPPSPQITQSGDAYKILKKHLCDLDHEQFWVLALSRANRVIKEIQISSGGVAGTVVDPKIVFKRLLSVGSSSCILAHNHPSGNLTPSRSDRDLTKKLVEAGKTLDLLVLDHIIVGNGGYYSFADEGEI